MEQKRGHVRIDDYIFFEFNLLEKDEYNRIKDDYIAKTKAIDKKLASSISPLTKDITERKEEKGRGGEADPVLVSMLVNLDKKLDLIINLLDEKGERKKSLKEKTRKVNIGGAGLRFQTEREFKKGDFLELKIELPLVPPVSVPALGEVTRAERNERGYFTTAVKFNVINEEDRDRIIRYVFQKQREHLRAKKEAATEKKSDH